MKIKLVGKVLSEIFQKGTSNGRGTANTMGIFFSHKISNHAFKFFLLVR